MGDRTEKADSPVMDRLLAHGHEFSFNQVMRLARMHLGLGGVEELPGPLWQERIRIRPDLSFGFPPADVARVERAGAENRDFLITATFLGLYGVSSPLPNHYTEELMNEAAADSATSRDFLDILHQRLYQLYFECCNKHSLFYQVEDQKSPQVLERLFCLIGRGHKQQRDRAPDPFSLLRYAGLFTQHSRSALGLQTLLRDALGVDKLEVEQCVLRTVSIPVGQRMQLGVANMSLGVNTILGSERADRMGKFRIHIGPLSKEEYDALLPGTPRNEKLAGLIRLYIPDPFEYDLKLILAAGEAEPIRLGDPNGPRLGLNSWCFTGETLGEVNAVFPLSQPAAEKPAHAAEAPSPSIEATKPLTLVHYYQEELARLRDLGASYAEAHPALASLVTGNPAALSVERLFEGAAFMSAHLRLRLEDDFPEIVHDLTHAVQPNDLRPIPATTIVVFTPKPTSTSRQVIPAGTELKSIPVDGTACRFTTRFPVEIHPLTLTNAYLSHPSGKAPAIILNLKLNGLRLEEWNLKSLRLCLSGEYSQACDLHLVLMRYLKRIVIAAVPSGQSVTLNARDLKAVGFDGNESLFHSEVAGATSHQMMQEYFIQPYKFLFLDLHGWERWTGRGEGAEFEIRFELDRLPFALHQISKADFALFATPAVNVFEHQAEPIVVDEQQNTYRIAPADVGFAPYDIYAVKEVVVLVQSTNRRIQCISSQHMTSQSRTTPTYRIEWRKQAMDDTLATFLSLEAPLETDSEQQVTTLLVELACTNGDLPEKLKIGDICQDSDNSPKYVNFSNCTPITRYAPLNAGGNALWRQYSHQHLNVSQLDAATLRVTLERILQGHNHDYTTARHLTNQIQGIHDLKVTATDNLIGRDMQRVWEIRIKLTQSDDDCRGSRYLFGALLAHFLSGFVTESCFTKMIIEDGKGGEQYEWPAMQGRKPLI